MSYIFVFCTCWLLGYLLCYVFNPYVSGILVALGALIGVIALGYNFPIVGLIVAVLFVLSLPSLFIALMKKIFANPEKEKQINENKRIERNTERRKQYALKKQAEIIAAHKVLNKRHNSFFSS